MKRAEIWSETAGSDIRGEKKQMKPLMHTCHFREDRVAQRKKT